MTQASEQISSQYASGAYNARVWGDLIINVKTYGAKGDGTTDDTLSIQAALDSLTSGGTLRFPTGTYKVTSSINVLSNVIVEGVGDGAVIKLSSGDMNGFLISSKSNTVVRDLKISCDVAGTTGTVGGIKLLNSTNCLIENVTFSGLSWAGALIFDSSYNTVKGCRFSGWLGTREDSSDICVYNNSSYNRIEGNYCYGGGQHGVFIQDPYSGATPTGNVVVGNQVGQHKTYGILVYVTTAYDTKTVIANNVVKDIQGSAGAAGSAGAGIYIQSAGGSIVTGNEVSNCCVQTTDFESNGMGHISVAVGSYGAGTLVDVIVSNNHINAPRGPGIFCATSNKGIILQGNTILVTGTTAVRGEGIYAINCHHLKIIGNIVRQSNTNYNAININSSNTAVAGIEISSNTIETVAAGIGLNASGTGTFTNVSLNGNRVSGGNGQALFLQKVTAGRIVGCDFSSTGLLAQFNSCTSLRIIGTRLQTSYGSTGVAFTGTGTGSIIDESNDIIGNLVVENNVGSGFIISQYNSAAPTTSTWNVGDRIIKSNPAVGQPKGWRCTVAGTPGTWVSEGNL